MMIHVVLDTNIYRHNPARDNLSFRALEQMAKAGLLKLHIPYIIEREFQTQQRKNYSDDLNQVVTGLNGLTRKQLSPTIAARISSLKEELVKDSEVILADSEIQFVNWAEDLGANRYSLSLEQAQEAFEAYFQGKPPFKQAKIRDDIPDAFIVQAVKSLSQANGKLHFIVGDKKVAEAFDSDDSIIVYKKLDEFIETELVQNELKEVDMLENLEAIKQMIQDYEVNEQGISKHITKEVGDQLEGVDIYSDEVPAFDNKMTIYGWWEPDNVELDFSELTYYGNGYFGMPFMVKMKASVTFYIYKSDYIGMSESSKVFDWNDHYFQDESDIDIIVNGMVSVVIDRDKIVAGNLENSIVKDFTMIDEISTVELESEAGQRWV
jgi:hypothetical protein